MNNAQSERLFWSLALVLLACAALAAVLGVGA
jgi:hypothetical protein